MTISSTVNRNSTAGDGIVTAFSFPYLFFADDDLTVILVIDSTGVETVQTITTHYTVTGAGVAAGGTVTMVTPPASGETLVIIRKEQFTQGLDLVENDPFPSDLVEQQLDTLTMLSQQLNTEQQRSIKLSDGDTSGVDLTLPTPAALKTIRWNAGATALEEADDPGVSATAAAASAAAAATSETNAATSETNAAASAAAASTSETNAGNSETAAAASAVAAAAAAASNLFSKVLTKAADYTIVADTDDGTMFVCDMTSGNVDFDLPSIVTAGEGERYGFLRSGASNSLTFTRNGTDTINGVAGTFTVDAVDGAMLIIIADDASPDNWLVVPWSQVEAGAGLTKSGGSMTLDLTNDNTWTGDQTFAAAISLDGTPDTDHTAVGPQTNTFQAGYSSTIMDLVYMGSGGKWLEADADATGTSINMLAIALEAKTDTQAMNVALPGSFVRDDTWNWTIGVPLYVSGTLGAITATAPSGSGDVVRPVGFAVTADVIYFNPSPDYSTVA